MVVVINNDAGFVGTGRSAGASPCRRIRSAHKMLQMPYFAVALEPVRWAWLNGVMTGYGVSGEFGPNDQLTRAQMAAVLPKTVHVRAPLLSWSMLTPCVVPWPSAMYNC